MYIYIYIYIYIYTYIFKKVTNVEKFYLLHKIDKGLSPRTPSNFKLWEAYGQNLRILRSQFSTTHETRGMYIKGNGDFLKKLRVVDGMPKGAILFIRVFHMLEVWSSFKNSTINSKTKFILLKIL